VLASVKPISRGATDKVMPLLAAYKMTKRIGCSNVSKADDSIISFAYREIGKALVENGPIIRTGLNPMPRDRGIPLI
jgi:hypothetical protein